MKPAIQLALLLLSIGVLSTQSAFALSKEDNEYVNKLYASKGTVEVNDEMVERLTKLLDAEPDNHRVRFLLGAAFERMGLESLAMEQYLKCIEGDPKNYLYNYQLLLMAFKIDKALAVKQITKCMELADGDGYVLMKLGITVENAGLSQFADLIYEQAAKSKKKAYGVGYSLAKLRFTQGRYDEALKCLNWDLTKKPNSSKCNILKGEILTRLDLANDALPYYIRAYKSSPCDSNAATLVAEHYLKQGRLKEALEPALTTILCSSQDRDKLNESKKVLGPLLKSVSANDLKEAVISVGKSAPSYAHRQFYYLALGDVFDSINRKKMAMDAYRKGLLITTNPPNNYALARGYYRLGLDEEVYNRDPEKALALYEKSIQLNAYDGEVKAAHKRLKARLNNRAKDFAGRWKDSFFRLMR